MSTSPKRKSQEGQYDELMDRITKVATQALRTAAKNAKATNKGAVKRSAASKAKPSGK